MRTSTPTSTGPSKAALAPLKSCTPVRSQSVRPISVPTTRTTCSLVSTSPITSAITTSHTRRTLQAACRQATVRRRISTLLTRWTANSLVTRSASRLTKTDASASPRVAFSAKWSSLRGSTSLTPEANLCRHGAAATTELVWVLPRTLTIPTKGRAAIDREQGRIPVTRSLGTTFFVPTIEQESLVRSLLI